MSLALSSAFYRVLDVAGRMGVRLVSPRRKIRSNSRYEIAPAWRHFAKILPFPSYIGFVDKLGRTPLRKVSA